MKNNIFRKRLIVIIISIFLIMIISPSNGTVVNDSVFIDKTESLVNQNNDEKTIYVDASNTEGPWDGTLEQPYQYIQEGIDASENKDTIIVASGFYLENIDFLGKAITMKSNDGPDVTIIDGNQSGSVISFINDESSNSVLDGFTITNGSGSHYPGKGYAGGGILCKESSPTIINNTIIGNLIETSNNALGAGIFYEGSSNITNNTIKNNYAISTSQGFLACGGGIFCDGFSPILRNNNIAENKADNIDCMWVFPSYGAGIYLYNCDAIIDNNIILNNSIYLGEGGGIFLNEDNSIITNNDIKENIASYGAGISCDYSNSLIDNNNISENSAQLSGGGIGCHLSSPTISNNTIVNNSADHYGGGGGGGIMCHSPGSPIIINNIISKNIAEWMGGGIKCYNSQPIVINNFITFNKAYWGGGIFCDGDCLGPGSINLTNNDICFNSADYSGGGVSSICQSTVLITNSILWNNDAPDGTEEISIYGGGNLTINFSDVKDGQIHVYTDHESILNWDNNSIINASPLFVNPARNDFHLTAKSPCIEVGNNDAQFLPKFDIDGDPRISNGLPSVNCLGLEDQEAIVDLGADEYYLYIPDNEPDLDCNGHLSWTNVKPGSTVAGYFTVRNVGDPGSELDWEISEKPWWGDWTITPDSGTDLADGDTLVVDVEVVASDDRNEEFTGEVKVVNSEEPDDFCIINVSLATLVSQQSLILQFLERIMERSPNAFPILRLLLEL